MGEDAHSTGCRGSWERRRGLWEGDRPVALRRELSECGEEDHVMPADSRESSLGGSGHTELHTPGEAPCQELAFCYEKTEVCKMMCDL